MISALCERCGKRDCVLEEVWVQSPGQSAVLDLCRECVDLFFKVVDSFPDHLNKMEELLDVDSNPA